jgi:hypothetical protein
MKRAQLQIMENAFILLVVFIILIMAFVFVLFIQRSQHREKLDELKELELIKKSQVLNFLPEIQCSDNNDIDPDCYDIQKIKVFQDALNKEKFYYDALLGYVQIEIKRYDPSPGKELWIDEHSWLVYDNPLPDYDGIKSVRFPVLLSDITENKNYFGIILLGVYE